MFHFHNILINTRSIFNNFVGVPYTFLFEQVLVIILLSSVILMLTTTCYILKNGYQFLTNIKSFRFVNMIILFAFLINLLE